MKTPRLLPLLAAALFCAAWLAPAAFAKRAAPAEVKPVVLEGVEYRAPSLGKMGVVEAWDKATGKMLWEKKVHTMEIDPALERDVQAVFITKLEIDAGKLIVTNERNGRYSIDLKTREVADATGALDKKDQDWIADPSLAALKEDGEEDGESVERYRLLADFNGDGIQDMALSCDEREFGNAGGQFTLYLGNAGGKYREHGEFFAHPDAVALEKVDDSVRLWTYSRSSGTEGAIGYQEVLKDKLSEEQSGMIIHPGDGGTAMGSAIYEAVFKNTDLPIAVEYSETKNGTIKWINPTKKNKEPK